MNKGILFILTLLFLASCGGSTEEKKPASKAPTTKEASKKKKNAMVLTARDVYTQALGAHDRIMPKMEEIGQLKSDLETKVQRGKFDDSMASEVDESIRALQKAYDDMMFWMEYVQEVDYHLDSESFSDHEKMEEASTMKAEILRIEKDFNSSISKAKALLRNA